MRVIGTLVTAATATAAVFAIPAAGAQAAATGSQCVQLQGLTAADLCVSVQPTAASVRPGAAAAFVVTVSVENGFTADVTVALSTGATYTSGCPDGDGSGSCSIASLNLLGSPSSYQLQAEVPAAAGATSVSLTATASVPTLLPWTPPAAGAAIAVAAPSPSPSPTPSKTVQASSSTSPAPGRSAPATRHPTSPATAGGKQTSPASTVAITAPTLPPIPLPSLPATGKSVVNAGNASGLFPTISATPSPSPSGPGATTGDVSAAAAGYQVPLAPAGLIIAILIALGGAGLGGRQYLHRRRDGKQ
jgi:hypothetical protein